MELNLLPVLNCDGKHMPLDLSLEIKEREADDFKILDTVVLRGEIVNVGGSLELTAEGKTRLERVCDRCLETFVCDLTFPVEERMKKVDAPSGEQEDPDVLLIEGTAVDMDEIVYTGLCLHLPSKVLCSESCQGLCPVCGQNRNHQQCSCDDRPADPRFDVLDQLLND